MRTSYRGSVGVTGVLVLVATGCTGPSQRLNAPPQGHAHTTSELRDYYTYMVDNGMLQDLSVADIHFVPHTAEINGLGVRRLTRYSELLQGLGGTIHLESDPANAELTEARLCSVKSFLATTGLDMTNVGVKPGLSQGRSLSAVDAIRIKKAMTSPSKDSKGPKDSILQSVGVK